MERYIQFDFAEREKMNSKLYHGLHSMELPFLGEQIVNRVCRDEIQLDDAYVISDPENPEFYWGNYVHLDAPEKWTIDQLENLYQEQLPHIRKRFLFSYNDDLELSHSSKGLRSKFESAGYNFEASVCLVAEADDMPVEKISNLTVKVLENDDDWQQAIENQFLCREIFDGKSEYIVSRMNASRKAAENGHGQWMGVFDKEKLVCDLGIYWTNGFCRFQAVGTHPDYRGKGIARYLVIEAVKNVAERRPDSVFIIMTGLGDRPQKIYEKCGFYPVSTHVGFMKHES